VKATIPHQRERRAILGGIPTSAREVVSERFLDGSKKEAEYFLRGRKVGARSWYENGQLADERRFRNGRLHGIVREWHPNGQPLSQTSYRFGREHGVARQWNPRGRLLGTYRMKHGTGVDLWWKYDGSLAEEHHWRNGRPHGLERWWWSRRWLSEERRWHHGVLHGIWRQWWAGKLRRGFPQFYLDGRKVSKARYLHAAARHAGLPQYDPKEDRPVRRDGPGRSMAERQRRGLRGR
jgi:antitoxin component YwqK of YwqJK toxin-antitoxin module